MQKTIITMPKMKLVGITVRTNNKSEMDPNLAKISSTVQKYFVNGLAEKISNRRKLGTTYCAYTNYASDFTGDYTYFIGEEVKSFDDINKELEPLIIPPQTYTKFTSKLGQMPTICIDMWQKIWRMNSKDLGGDRTYIADFEVYDERSQDQNNTVLDIYIGIK